jgi:hypothetical protein
MPASKRPAPRDAVTAQRILIGGLARDADIFGIVSELAPLHPRNDTFPGEVFLRLGADALDCCGASRADPVALEGIADRFLSECTFRGRDKRKFQFAVLAVAALHGGAEPDLLEEVVWWQTDDFWQYALFAAIAYIRAAADRAGMPVRQVAKSYPGVDNGPDRSACPGCRTLAALTRLGSQTGSQCRQTSGHIRRQPAMVSPARSPIGPHPATSSDGAYAPDPKIGGLAGARQRPAERERSRMRLVRRVRPRVRG